MNQFQSVVELGTTIRKTLSVMGASPGNKHIAGFAVVVDADGRAVAVVTDGDVRRGLSGGASVEDPIEKIANFSPLMLDRTLNREGLSQAFMDEVRQRGSKYHRYDKVVLVESNGIFHDVVRLADIGLPLIEDTRRYYEIARLRRGDGIDFDPKGITVDLDKVTEADRIMDDVALVRAAGLHNYFYLSGGGSVILNGRYLLVVRRSANVRVNPGRLSLFTGRAEGPSEWREPWRVVRELFEELILFSKGDLVRFRFERFQDVIDTENEIHRGRYPGGAISIDIKQVPLPLSHIEVREQGSVSHFEEHVHVNSNNELNAIYIFSADLDLEQIAANDGETGDPTAPPREIACLDLKNGVWRSLASGALGEWQPIGRELMSEHLADTVDLLRRGS